MANIRKEAEQKRPVLLSGLGAQTYVLVRNLLSLNEQGDCSYKDLIKLLKNNFQPKTSETMQRWKFTVRNMKPDESVSIYVV